MNAQIAKLPKTLLRIAICGNITRYIPFLNCIKLKDTKLRLSGAIIARTVIDCIGKGNTITIDNCSILYRCKIHVRGNNNTIHICNCVYANTAEIWIEDDNNVVNIGEGTSLCGRIHFACIEGTQIVMGSNCLCSSEIVMRTGDSHSIVDEHGKRINPSKNIVIGNHCWIGYHTMLNKGARLQNDSIVGTAAVVTKEFNNGNIIVAGVPAEIIKENINWDSLRLPLDED